MGDVMVYLWLCSGGLWGILRACRMFVLSFARRCMDGGGGGDGGMQQSQRFLRPSNLHHPSFRPSRFPSQSPRIRFLRESSSPKCTRPSCTHNHIAPLTSTPALTHSSPAPTPAAHSDPASPQRTAQSSPHASDPPPSASRRPKPSHLAPQATGPSAAACTY